MRLFGYIQHQMFDKFPALKSKQKLHVNKISDRININNIHDQIPWLMQQTHHRSIGFVEGLPNSSAMNELQNIHVSRTIQV